MRNFDHTHISLKPRPILSSTRCLWQAGMGFLAVEWPVSQAKHTFELLKFYVMTHDLCWSVYWQVISWALWPPVSPMVGGPWPPPVPMPMPIGGAYQGRFYCPWLKCYLKKSISSHKMYVDDQPCPGSFCALQSPYAFTLRRWRQRLVERFFDMNMTKTRLWLFSTWGTKNAHCATCAFSRHAGFSQIRSHIFQ